MVALLIEPRQSLHGGSLEITLTVPRKCLLSGQCPPYSIFDSSRVPYPRARIVLCENSFRCEIVI